MDAHAPATAGLFSGVERRIDVRQGLSDRAIKLRLGQAANQLGFRLKWSRQSDADHLYFQTVGKAPTRPANGRRRRRAAIPRAARSPEPPRGRRQQRHREPVARGGRAEAGLPRKGPRRELPPRPGVCRRDESARSATRDCHELDRRLPAAEPTSTGHRSSDARATTTATIRGWRSAHLGRRSQTRWPSDRRRANSTWSILLDRLPHTRRDVLNGSGIDAKDRGRERCGFLDLGYRSVDPPGHRECDRDLRWGYRAQPHPDRLNAWRLLLRSARLYGGSKALPSRHCA